MARVGLRLVPDALVTATVCDIKDEEFVLLYDAYSKWIFPRFDINTLSEDECHTKL